MYSADVEDELECIHIPGVGDFSCEQLCVMQDAWMTKKAIMDAFTTSNWLRKDFPTKQLEKIVKEIDKWSIPLSAKLCALFIQDNPPSTLLPGFSFPMHVQQVLAVGEVISRRTGGASVMRMLPMHSSAKKDDTINIPEDLVTFVGQRLLGGNRDKIFSPLTVDRSHWALLVMDRPNKKLMLYDSFEKKNIQKLLKRIGAAVLAKCAVTFSMQMIGSPVQKVFYDCCIYVTHFSWNQAELPSPSVWNPGAMKDFRVQILKDILFSVKALV